MARHAGDDPVETVWLTLGREAVPVRLPRSLGPELRRLVRQGTYGVPRLDGWEPEVIVDAGACVGFFSVLMLHAYPGTTVLAYEPASDSFALLQQNLAGRRGVECVHAGLLDRDAELFLHHGANNPGEASLRRGRQQTAAGETARFYRASAELSRRGVRRLGILKLDTEGSELPILRDLAELLPRVDYVLVEYHDEADRLEIDRLLHDDFVLFGGEIAAVARGVLKYINRSLVGVWEEQELRLLTAPRRPS